MSGSLGSVYNSVLWAISEHSNALANLQEQVSTGKRINRISDDPVDSHRILELKSQQRQKEGYMNGIDDVYNFLDISAGVLQNMSSKITEAKSLLTGILSATSSSNQAMKDNAAEGIDMMLEDLVSLANWNHRDQYVFGGADSTKAPYEITRENGKIVRVDYQGSSQARVVEINDSLDMEMNTVGDNFFAVHSRSAPLAYGNTGIAIGSGTSTVKGNFWLDVEEVSGGYRLSIDGGESWVTVSVPPGSENKTVANSVTGEILYVDTRAITQAGSEHIKVPGTYDIFNQLIEIRDLLKNTRNLSDSDFKVLAESAIKDFESLHSNLTQGFTILGTKLGSLDNIKTSVEDAKLNAEEGIAGLEQADIAQISTDIARRQTLYQMSLMVASKMFSLSILNYIR